MAKEEEITLIDRAALLGKSKRRFAVYRIEHLGDVRVRNLTEAERSQFEVDNLNDDLNHDRGKVLNAKRRLICACVVDAEGNPILTLDDVVALGEVDGAITGALFDVCQKHCGFKPGDIERLAGNDGGGSTSSSRSRSDDRTSTNSSAS